jgi:hypothetical protein
LEAGSQITGRYTHSIIGMDIEYIPKDVGKKWLQEATEISAMLSGLIKTKRGFLKINEIINIFTFLL